MSDIYSDQDLDNMELTQRVTLASQGEIPWSAVNRVEADVQRNQRAEEAVPLSTRIRRAPLCRNASELRRRRHVRRSIYREERARVEHMLRNGLNDSTLALQEA